jgi:hypothetical protein
MASLMDTGSPLLAIGTHLHPSDWHGIWTTFSALTVIDMVGNLTDINGYILIDMSNDRVSHFNFFCFWWVLTTTKNFNGKNIPGTFLSQEVEKEPSANIPRTCQKQKNLSDPQK